MGRPRKERDRDDEKKKKKRRKASRSSSRSRSRSRTPKRRTTPVRRQKERIIDEETERERERYGKNEEKPPKPKQTEDTLTRAGGAYIPPAKLKMLQAQISDKNSEQYQRLSWEHLKKRIHGHVNKINVANIVQVVKDLLQENLVRGKGLFARSIIQAQAFSPSFSHVYAALVAIINSKFPHIGELIARRLCIQFKRAFARNDKQVAITASKFIAHLTNQQVVHELLALEVLTLLLENATDDSIEVAVAFIKECGAKLAELTARGVDAIFASFRKVLSEGEVDIRVQYMIEVLCQIRKDKFSAHPSVIAELDLVEEADQITHTIALDDVMEPENKLNVFNFDPDFEKNEHIYEEIRKEILGEGDDDEDEDGGEGDEEDAEEGGEGDAKKQTVILDNTEANIVAFRRTVYLAIQSSLDYQEAVHKLLKMQISPDMQVELCHMILDCCAQNRTYEKFYGLMAERFCRLKKEYQEFFEQLFKDSYDTVHRLEIMKLRNVSKFFSHLLYSDAISWMTLSHMKLTESDTTSAGRVFIKILFQELSEYLGLEKLYTRIQDATMQEAFDGLFPRDNPHDTRFSINFFTSIGLGGLTVDLREHLAKVAGTKDAVGLPVVPKREVT